MQVDLDVYKTLYNIGADPDYLMGLDYDVPDWPSLLKQAFPTDREAIIYTNGKHATKIEELSSSHRQVGHTLEQTIDAVMKLKAVDPELPVYEIHNHPTAEVQARRLVSAGTKIGEDTLQIQRAIASVPSKADIKSWDQTYNLHGAGIYHQDSNEIRVWTHGAETNRVGTKLAIEYELQKFDDAGFILDEPIKQPTNVRWAAEDEDEPNTEYIDPADWPAVKDKWMPLLDWEHTTAPWAK